MIIESWLLTPSAPAAASDRRLPECGFNHHQGLCHGFQKSCYIPQNGIEDDDDDKWIKGSLPYGGSDLPTTQRVGIKP